MINNCSLLFNTYKSQQLPHPQPPLTKGLAVMYILLPQLLYLKVDKAVGYPLRSTGLNTLWLENLKWEFYKLKGQTLSNIKKMYGYIEPAVSRAYTWYSIYKNQVKWPVPCVSSCSSVG